MLASYDPKVVENNVCELWKSEKAYKQHSKTKVKFQMLLPPPNLTSALHIGHCLTYAIQDSLTRWHRMKGDNPVWIPGTDAGGIGTEIVVRKYLESLMKESESITDRSGDFKDELNSWTLSQHGIIKDQAARMGASLTWEHAYNTMDDIHSHFVQDRFIELFEKKLIYRRQAHVNWCPSLKTSLSDVETDTMFVDAGACSKSKLGDIVRGYIITIKYPILGEGNRYIYVSTTRLETYPGDVAIAVHPDDDRYRDLIGSFAWHKLDERKIPIIADGDIVDMTFGTGAVKVTPAHCREDREIALRHELPSIQVFRDDGCLIGKKGSFLEGVNRPKAKSLLEHWFKQQDLWVKTEPHALKIPICGKTGDILEVMLKDSWYLNTTKFAVAALDTVRSRRIQIQPESELRTLEGWLLNNKDWCLSRSIVHGHSIPMYRVPNSHNWIAAKTVADAIVKCKELGCEINSECEPVQDSDVLDTWFASSLIHYNIQARLNHSTDDYITDVLETGKDIIYFWVARIIILGLALERPLPFQHVILHNLIRDEQGRKMSKSLGNVINPIDLIDGRSQESMIDDVNRNFLISDKEKQRSIRSIKSQFPNGIMPCGSDSLRFTLLLYTRQKTDIHFDIRQLIAKRKWCNKIWNGFKYVINRPDVEGDIELTHEEIPECCHRINDCLKTSINCVSKKLSAFEVGDACACIYAFWQHDFCDNFIEKTKQFSDPKESATNIVTQTLFEVLVKFIKLLHPFMPFLSEHIWQIMRNDSRFQTDSDLLMLSSFPD